MESGLHTDLYQLTMAAGYWKYGMNGRACFELFTRRLPKDRGYLIAAGLEQVIEYLEGVRFSEEDVAYLRTLKPFQKVDEGYFDYLRKFRFTGDLWAVPEGTVVFADEPILRIVAPLIEAQVVETYILSVINFQTLIATKAARVVNAAQLDGKKRRVIEFGTRRAHGPAAGYTAARAAYIGGCDGTSNVAAGKRWGIPVFGTAAHAWTLACSSEQEAFERYYALYPETCTLLIDTYDVISGAKNAVKVGKGVLGVRIDSGDLAEQARQVREILDAAGMHATRIVLSGDLNEYLVAGMVKAGVPVDDFGVGTDLVVSRDAPALGGVYKLVEREGKDGQKIYTAKFSPGKVTLPGAKQIFRQQENGKFVGDILGLAFEEYDGTSKLLEQFIKDGECCRKYSLEEARERAKDQLEALPEEYKQLESPARYPVEPSKQIIQLLEQLKV
ncbi:MAG: nicotinate phosphoribosyltransferase [Acidobacteriota bacterium]|nr:nicotinate phosphoribosyltransferase [Blastocatellia bacterium]MDW8413142.1 nicotinate phosphoribosyltransferase [Acidobacteriota bacterium]